MPLPSDDLKRDNAILYSLLPEQLKKKFLRIKAELGEHHAQKTWAQLRNARESKIMHICLKLALEWMDDTTFARFIEVAEHLVEEAGFDEFRWWDADSEP